MMSLASATALASGHGWLEIAVKATILLGLGLASIALARHLRASRRHLVLAATFAALLALPLSVTVPLPVRIGIPVGVPAPRTPAEPARDEIVVTASQPSFFGSPGQPDRTARLTAASIVRTAWTIGSIAFWLPMIAMLWQMCGMRRTATTWTRGCQLAEQVGLEAGFRRRVTVILHEDVQAPMTSGLWRPAILLPTDAPTWSESDVTRALLHELEHVRRADWLGHIVARATCAVYWWHPLAWLAWRRFHLEAERACDDAVAERSDRRAYAEQLVTTARRLSCARPKPVLAMAGTGDLSHRVLAVLDDTRVRGRAGVVPTLAAALTALVALAGLAPLKAVVRVQSATQPAAPKPSFDVASIRRNLSGPPGTTPGDFETFAPMPDGLLVRNATVFFVIMAAYEVPPWRADLLVGGPDWIAKDRFDVAAKAARRVERPEVLLMAQALLEQRFGLVLQPEPRERDVFALTLARRDGRLGPELRQAEPGCAPPTLESMLAARKAGAPPTPNATRCGTIGGLVQRLERDLRTTVVDSTGLTGRWDYTLTYRSDGRRPPPVPGLEPLPVNPDAPSLAIALQEQLGLRLDRKRGMVDALVIKSVSQPTEN
jgi:uncharacterized protein (TIGR03435 family)